MTTKFKPSIAALLLLAIAAFVPACDVLDVLKKPCNPEIEICEFTGNHPGTLAN